MLRRLIDRARATPSSAILAVEVALAGFVLAGVGLAFASPFSTLPFADIGLRTAAAAITALTITSLLAASYRFVRLVTGRGGIAIESFWRGLELIFALFVTGIVALGVRLGEAVRAAPTTSGDGGSVYVGLFLAFVLAGVGLAVLVCLRAMWRVVNAEIQSALGAA
ncbi:hypothetical protein ACFQJC_10740 [Haloferax namakaokahaiae]|uniref:DUF2975 domain-containing protein n=1 Tax=Haloferax namakaokahaiae TaxID=1748331 RepID=A0ABD5ZFE2_9EURY